MTRKNIAPAAPIAHPSAASSAETDQTVASLKSQLAVIQAERALLNERMLSPWTPSRSSRHGVAGWLFSAASSAFLVAMVAFAVAQPPMVHVIEVPEVTRVVATVDTLDVAEPSATEIPVAPETVASNEADEFGTTDAVDETPATPASPTRTRPRTPRPTTSPTTTPSTTTGAGSLDFQRDPIHGLNFGA